MTELTDIDTTLNILEDRLESELERGEQTHKSLEVSMADKYGYSEESVIFALSELQESGTVTKSDGSWKLTE